MKHTLLEKMLSSIQKINLYLTKHIKKEKKPLSYIHESSKVVLKKK